MTYGRLTDEDEPGLAAVRKRFGPEIEERIRSWPILAERKARAFPMVECYCRTCPPEFFPCGACELAAKEVKRAEENLDRARVDRDYALDQAEMISRDWSRLRKGTASRPTVERIDAEAHEEVRAWGQGHPDRQATGRLLVAVVPSSETVGEFMTNPTPRMQLEESEEEASVLSREMIDECTGYEIRWEGDKGFCTHCSRRVDESA